MRGQRHAPAAPYPRERSGTHCTGGWVGLRAGLDWCGKSRPPPGFDPRTVQPVGSRYTDYATRPTISSNDTVNIALVYSGWTVFLSEISFTIMITFLPSLYTTYASKMLGQISGVCFLTPKGGKFLFQCVLRHFSMVSPYNILNSILHWFICYPSVFVANLK